MTTLHEAVHKTANSLLDTPEFEYIGRWADRTDLQERLLNALLPLGYAKTRKGKWTMFIHPLAHQYFKQFGEEYVLLLEATQRLTQ